jgi:8-oxo-dGTP diphosphatase
MARIMKKRSLKPHPLGSKKEDGGEAATVDRITIVVGAVIRDEGGRVLLVMYRRERKGFWEGKWNCPGGELEFGEMRQEAITREVREETNPEVTLTQSLPPFQRIARSEEKPHLHVIYIDYLAEIRGGKVKAGEDVGEALWFTPEEIYQRWEDLHDDTKRRLSLARVI